MDNKLHDEDNIFFDSAPVGFLIVDRDNSIVEANRTAAQMLGVDTDSLPGSSFTSYIDPAFRDSYHASFQEAFESCERRNLDLPMKKKDGGIFYVHLACQAARDEANGRDICRIVISNATENKELVHSRMVLEAFNLSVLTEALNPIVFYNYNDGILYVNKALENLTGYSSAELIGLHPPFPWWPEEYAEQYKNDAFPDIQSPGVIPERRYRKRNGEIFWAYVSIRFSEVPGMGKCLLSNWIDITRRKMMEEALAESRKNLEDEVKKRTAELQAASAEAILRATILDMASDAILVYTQDGDLVYANQAAHQLYGYTPDEMADFNISRLIPPDEIQDFHTGTAAVIDRGDVRSDANHLRKDGSLVPIETHSHLIETNSRRYIISVIRDCTERRQAEEKLRYQAMLQDNVSDAIFTTDMEERITSWNKAAEEIYGWKEEEVLGRDMREITRMELPQEEKKESIKHLLEHGSWEREHIHRKKDGTPFFVSSAVTLLRDREGKPVRVVSINRDITEKKQAKDEIAHNELRLRSILDAMTEGIALIAPDGTVVLTNKAEAQMLGLSSPEERIGFHFRSEKLDHIYPDGSFLPLEETAIIKAIKSKCSIRNYEEGLVREDGSILWINSNAVPIINDTGEIIGVVRTMTDITVRKQMMDQREQFTKRLLDVQEEERKRISRELHDDTAQYLALLTLEMDSLIEKEKGLPPETIARLQKLRESASRTLQEVRRFSHELRPSVLEHFGLPSALELIINEFRTSCQTAVSFSCDGAEKRLPDEIELALFRITQEALSNIRKHSGASEAEVVLTCNPHKVRLVISDNGKGFKVAPEKQAGHKSSLGLVGMKERAHIIGANLRVNSQVNKGTVICVDLALK